MCRVVYLTFGLLLLVGLDAQRAKKFFRKDYKYIDASESFYKIHTIHKTWQEARDVCASEGATLFYPDDEAEADAVITFWNQTQPFYWVYIGISDLLVKGVFETVDGLQVSEVYTNWEPGEPNDRDGNEDCVIIRRSGYMNDDKCYSKFPFICKKTLASLEWNTLCNTPYTDYMYSEQTGKCYKFHLKPRNWTDAYAACSAEQSYLSVVDSQVEADYLKELTEKAPKENIKGNYLRGLVLLGFHNRNGDGWKTIKGELLEDSGFTKWANKQPDGGDKENCGSLFYNGLYNDISCATKAFFICEHDVDLLAGLLNERFGDE